MENERLLEKGFPLGGSWRRRRLMRGDQFALAQCLQSLVLSLPPIKCVAAPCKKSIPPRATKTSPESTRTKQSETKFHHAKAGALGGSSGRMREVWREKGHPPKGGPFSHPGLLLTPPRSFPNFAKKTLTRRKGCGIIEERWIFIMER